MVLGSWRVNIIWKLLQNDSVVFLESLEIDSESFLNVKVYFLDIVLILNLYFSRFQNSDVISQHLLINLGLGPLLKCAPGHDSMEDFSIIKNYWLKSGVVDKQN